jgi:hypothetical protein
VKSPGRDERLAERQPAIVRWRLPMRENIEAAFPQ